MAAAAFSNPRQKLKWLRIEMVCDDRILRENFADDRQPGGIRIAGAGFPSAEPPRDIVDDLDVDARLFENIGLAVAQRMQYPLRQHLAKFL